MTEDEILTRVEKLLEEVALDSSYAFWSYRILCNNAAATIRRYRTKLAH